MSVKLLTSSNIQDTGKTRSIFSSTGIYGFGLVAGGDFEPIATVTVGSGGASSIEFTSIPSTFAHLQIRGILKDTGGTPERTMEIQIGNGSVDTGSNYAWHYLSGIGTSVTEGGASSEGSIRTTNLIMFDTANIFSAFTIDFLDYASTAKATTVRLFGGFDSNGAGRVSISSGLWTSTSAVDRIKIGTRSGFAGTLAEFSTLALYGVKAP